MEGQDALTMWFYIILGFCGILFHVYIKVQNKGGVSFGDFWAYIKGNQLATFFSILVYAALVMLWELEGFDFFGWKAGVLNGSIIGVGYMGNSVFKTLIKAKVGDKLTQTDEEDKP